MPAVEELLQFLYLTPVGVVKFRADGHVELLNPVASALLQSLAPAHALDDLYAALAPLEPNLRESVAHFTEPAGSIIDQRWLKAGAGGSGITLSLTVNKIKDDVFMAVLTDVTRLAEQERTIYADRQKFFAIFDHVRDYAIYTLTNDGMVDEWNPSLQRYAGWLAGDVEGRSLSLFFPRDDPQRPQLEPLLTEARRTGSTETEGWRVKRDGTRLWATSVITALPDEAGTVRGFVVVSHDITGRKQLEDRMEHFATVDPLTGAFNRRHADALLAYEFHRRARSGRPFAFLMMDIDHFKAINDRFGHLAGDAVLCALVTTCRATLRTIDTVVRWGGEEFAIILPETAAPAASAAAERLRAALAATDVLAEGEHIHFTISIGVAVPTGDDPRALLRRSDDALYSAKAGGRNTVRLAD
jgi:diguanylate cyclase (GGDEF)-like protein/PAS domain S-box-containing protein